MARPVDVKNNIDAEIQGWTIRFGRGIEEPENHRLEPGPAKSGRTGWELVQKAWYEDDDERVLHTTKRLAVPGGWLYETYTEIVRYGEPKVVGLEPATPDGQIMREVLQKASGVVSCSKAVEFVPIPKP